jgi:nucleotide-binding universal stress UspA family protein
VVQFTNILCPVDFTESSTRALGHAATLARWYDARLTVLHVVPTFDPALLRPTGLEGSVQFVQPPSRDDVTSELGRAVEATGVAPPTVALAADSGDPVSAIVDRAISTPADLVVMGTHGRGGFERLLLGSVTEKVLRKAPCPVLTVPPHATGTLPAEVRFTHILCPVDFSESSLQAIGFALDLARQADGVVTLLHVVEWLPEVEPETFAQFNVPDYRRHLVEDARARLQKLTVGEPRWWSEIKEVVAIGRSHREILRVATEASADLIVMGAQGRGGVELALFGSTTQQVVRAAGCPVLTIRMSEPGRVA